MDLIRFAQLLKTKCRLQMDLPVIVGVSGGPDSLVLLDLLFKIGIPIIVGHFNHQLRAEAIQDAELVQDFCRQRNVECVLGQADVLKNAEETKRSVEESARVLRYQFLFSLASERNGQAVLVAHHADDQVETILMHLLRGSGLSGLKGMRFVSIQPQWSHTIPIVRPLLETSRAEIINYCEINQLLPVHDLSNNDTRYFRNRIRHDLLPYLATYNSQIKTHLLNLSEIIGHEEDFLQEMTEKTLQGCRVDQGKKYIRLNIEQFKSLHEAMRRRILRSCIQQVDPDLRDIDFESIRRGLDFIDSSLQTNSLLILADIELIKDRHQCLIICDRRDPLTELWPQTEGVLSLKTVQNGIFWINEHWQIKTAILESVDSFSRDEMICVIDGEKVTSLIVDTIKPGERFAPFSLKGKSIKVSDFWTKKGLPERARANWPILKNEIGEIVWVPGFQISDTVKVTPQTRVFLEIRLVHS